MTDQEKLEMARDNRAADYQSGMGDGADAERTAIVAWLNRMAANWTGPVGTAALEMAARQITRLDHHGTKGEGR